MRIIGGPGKIIERGAVYDGHDNTVGFRCSDCGRVFQSMLGDTCNGCQNVERRHKELLKAAKK